MGMSNAERQERWRARRAKEVEELRKAAARAATAKPTVDLSRELAEARAEIERLRKAAKAHAREQAASIPPARKPATKPADPDSDLARAKATIADLRRGLKYFQKRPDGKVDDRTFTLLRSHMHPDRVSDPEQKARYKIAFEVFGELEKRVVDKDQAFLANEKWDRVRKKKPEAKKRQPPEIRGRLR